MSNINEAKPSRVVLRLLIPQRGNTPSTRLHIEIDKYDHDTRPVLMTLPGGPGASGCALFQSHSASLNEDYQVVYWDPRGCGQSAVGLSWTYSTESYVEDVEAIRAILAQHFGAPYHKVTILGASYGGMAACEYAVRYPHCLASLILVATSGSYAFIETARRNLLRVGNLQQYRAFHCMSRGKFVSGEHARQCYALLAPLYSKQIAKKYEQDPTQLHYFALPGFNFEFSNNEFPGWMAAFNILRQLDAIQVPVLIMSAQDDWVCDPVHSEALLAAFPHAIHKHFDDCGHAIAVDQNIRYLQAIREFMRKYFIRRC